MSMYSDDIGIREFVVAQEGYDREEVRAYLEVIAREQQALRDELTQLRDRTAVGSDVGSEIAGLLQSAREQAEETTRLANEEADAIRARAEADADILRQATIDATDRAREEADLYAFEARSNADREVREKLRQTNEKIEALLAGAAKVRDRLYGVDTTLVTLRNEVVMAAEALDGVEVEEVRTASVPPPPPPPAVIDLTDSSLNGSRISTDA